MAIQDIRLKIHHIDGDMSAPWEYYDTVMKCEVGTPMVVNYMGDGASAAVLYKVTAVNAADETVAKTRGVWLSMGEYADGVSFEELASDDEDALAAALSKAKPMPMVYIRNDMVLESVSRETSHVPGDLATMMVNEGKTKELVWVDKDADKLDKLPTFLVIDAQPMVEGQDLPQKLLLRYIG